MGSRIDTATATQAQPTAAQASGGYFSGAIAVNASGLGSGTWSAKYNFAPVTSAGVICEARSITISNSTKANDGTQIFCSEQSYIGWWSDVSGTVSLTGSIDG